MQILTDILSVFVFYRSTFHTSRFKLIYCLKTEALKKYLPYLGM